ncbi:MAG: tyrosine-type recombinase/integrase [Chitinophagales bacterium]|nr:tyrosine-type recombinase/integrase [Chitinophagales bacterium]MDW8427061.1 tyrosine-type recombinase/integrase [Chitinophagales bacterium]
MELATFFNYLQYEKRYSPHTLAAYRNDLQQFCSFLSSTYQIREAREIAAQHIRSWIVYMVEHQVGARSINRKISALQSFFRFLKRSGKLQANPMRGITAPKAPKRLPDFIPSSHLQHLFNSIEHGNDFPGLRNRLILELLYATGMRRAELIALSDDAIDWNRNYVRVLGKGNKQRLIPIGVSLQESIKKYLEVRNQHFGRSSFARLVVSDRGKEMNPRSVYEIVRRLLKQMSHVSRCSPHVLRHTFATHLLSNGAELQAIKELLGHASLAATQVYTHNTVEQLKAIYRKAHPKA